MTVEIGALLQKDFGQKVLEAMNKFEGVKSVTVEMGRSSDLFDEKQFGDFGEAAILSIVAEKKAKDKVLMQFMSYVSYMVIKVALFL